MQILSLRRTLRRLHLGFASPVQGLVRGTRKDPHHLLVTGGGGSSCLWRQPPGDSNSRSWVDLGNLRRKPPACLTSVLLLVAALLLAARVRVLRHLRIRGLLRFGDLGTHDGAPNLWGHHASTQNQRAENAAHFFSLISRRRRSLLFSRSGKKPAG